MPESSGGDLEQTEKIKDEPVTSHQSLVKEEPKEREAKISVADASKTGNPKTPTNGDSQHQTVHPQAEPRPILLKPRRVASAPTRNPDQPPPPPARSISWVDDQGGGLVEVHYGEELHYSIFSRDREIARRQQLRSGCIPDDLNADLVDGRRCCVVS